jgi:anti-sigma factor RsiW
MNPSHPSHDTAESELVAYLDGELTDAQTEAVERRLSSDAEFRQRLHQLQRAWDLLDSLPRVEATEAFTQSTLEMVAVRAEADAAEGSRLTRAKRWLAISASGLGATAAVMAGFVFGRSLWPSPDEPLVRDMPVVERVDEYLLAENVEFLRMLQREGVFTEETRDAP